MLPSIVEIQENGCHLSRKFGFLNVQREHALQGQVPLSDIAVLMVTAYGASFSKEALVSLAQNGAISVLCGSNSMPEAMVLPVKGNYETAARIRAQMSASKPLQKRLWQAIVMAKLENQALVLEHSGKKRDARTILDYRRDVDSGDIKNREASGARIYWKALMGESFRREREGAWPNPALNYGYAILRACAARAICASGLLPYLGMHHQNDTNNFPLADDIMEPWRPLVDVHVSQLHGDADKLSPEHKQSISRFIWSDVSIEGIKAAFSNAMERCTHSLVESYKTKECRIVLPTLLLDDNE